MFPALVTVILAVLSGVSSLAIPQRISRVNIECTFTSTAKHALYGFNDQSIYNINLERCMEECTDNAQCLSFDYNTYTDSCFLSTESKQTQPQAFGKHSKVTYYEKQCREVEPTTIPPTWHEITTQREVTTPHQVTTTFWPFTITDEESSGSGSGSGGDEESGESTDCFKKYGPYGGSGGSSFSDEELAQHGRITALEVRYGFLVNCIGFTYGSHVGDCHSNEDGDDVAKVTLDDDEYITAIEGRFGDVLDKITFRTNKSSYGPYGRSNGGSSFEVDSQGRELAYIAGKAGDMVDRLEFYFRC